ncbi:Piso0_001526 [Millerozyma farinosa CBS 7064]|uniref:Piso0_001526 protein n=1 Tax=Pichia sorbitophila (strain ATCC MYA-4447 / BCRC 22081 / CBS 7064 / NBRC 10061 / NRRL Y-12695) TaxID=559304 RepID=G8YL13_PICSO|nr:Piso0_001526 [Millerozyma farinosa CBS 7064]
MVYFEVTDSLRHIISSSPIDESLKEELIRTSYISHENLLQFYLDNQPTKSFLELIRQCKLYVGDYIPEECTRRKPKSKEYIEFMNKLMLEEKANEYDRLVNKRSEFQTLYDHSSKDSLTPSQEHKQVKSQITTIFNIFISVASVTYAIWYWSNSSMRLNDAYRALLCLFFGLIVLIAEVFVYMSYLNKVEEAKIKERSKKEIKKVIKNFE